ncbi:MAG: HD-GYP domain-containing protein [bacterium]
MEPSAGRRGRRDTGAAARAGPSRAHARRRQGRAARTLLRKPGPLSSEERAIVAQHVDKGVALLRAWDVDEAVLEIVAAHHERWDGAGYPRGLAGEAIPLAARILAIADSFDAMTSRRAYHGPRTRDEAATELRREAGRQFDAGLVDLFMPLLCSAAA